jgi:hypothetical protein
MPFSVDQKWIEAAEQQLGRHLPSSYRSAMSARNGGTVFALDDDWEIFPIFDQSERERIRRTSNDIVRETRQMQEWAGWPVDALSIATNGMGDALVLLPSEMGYADSVYAWRHETGQITEVAPDFSHLEKA